VAVAIAGSLALTASASSAPLQTVWTDAGLHQRLIDVGRVLQRWFPFLAAPREPSAVDFSGSANIRLEWSPNSTVAVTMPAPPRGGFILLACRHL
jgi:hypothetical protein